MIVTIEQTWQGLREFPLVGRYFRLLETVNPVTVKIGHGRQSAETLENVEAGAWFKVQASGRDFDYITIETSTSEAVKFVVTDGEAGYDRIFTAFSQARTLTLPGNATVGTSAAVVLSAATRAKVVFTADEANMGDIALGPAGVTLANAAVILAPGDSFIEDLAASAAWYAIATSAAQTLRVMTAA